MIREKHNLIWQTEKSQSLSSFSEHTDLGKDTDVFFSVGGDGTLLRSLELIRDTEIPVIGVNTGRLGFLATLQADDIQIALQAFVLLEKVNDAEASNTWVKIFDFK